MMICFLFLHCEVQHVYMSEYFLVVLATSGNHLISQHAERTSVVTTAGSKSISGMDVAIGVYRTCTPASSTVDVYILSSISRARYYVIVAASIRDLLAYTLFSSINNDGPFKVIASIAASAVVSLTDSTRMGWTA